MGCMYTKGELFTIFRGIACALSILMEVTAELI